MEWVQGSPGGGQPIWLGKYTTLFLPGDVKEGAWGWGKGRLFLAGDVEEGAWGRERGEGQIVACW